MEFIASTRGKSYNWSKSVEQELGTRLRVEFLIINLKIWDNADDLRNKDNLKNDDKIKNEEDLKNEDDL